MYKPVFNPDVVPHVIDSAGRTIGGGEWGIACTTDAMTARVIADGTILQSDFTDEPTSPEFLKIAEKAAAVNERTEKLEAMDNRRLGLLAAANAIPHDDSVVTELAYRTDVDLNDDNKTTRKQASKRAAATTKES